MSLVDKSYLSQIISPFIVILTMLVSVLIYIGQKNKDRKESAVRIGDDLERLSDYMAYNFSKYGVLVVIDSCL